MDILRYFTSELNVSIRHTTYEPESDHPQFNQVDDNAAREAFSLMVAIANKDIKTFNALWDDYTAWSKEHLVRVVRQLVHEKWVPGL